MKRPEQVPRRPVPFFVLEGRASAVDLSRLLEKNRAEQAQLQELLSQDAQAEDWLQRLMKKANRFLNRIDAAQTTHHDRLAELQTEHQQLETALARRLKQADGKSWVYTIPDSMQVPELQEAAPVPAWLETALSAMTEIDRQSVINIRRLLEGLEGPNQQWYYAAAGMDVMPLVVAPGGTTLHCIDPMYDWRSAPEATPYFLENCLEQSFLRTQAHTVSHEQTSHGATTHLAGDTTVHWDSRPAEDPETVPEQIDVIYTTTTSGNINPRALDVLKVGGLLISSPTATKIVEHPAMIEPLTAMGFSALPAEPFIGDFQLQDAYTLGVAQAGSRGFSLYEKTRPLTERDRTHLLLNDVSVDCYNVLLSLVHQKHDLQDDQYQPTIDRIAADGKERIALFRRRLEQEASPDEQDYALEVFADQIAGLLPESDGSFPIAAWDWVAGIDSQLHQYIKKNGATQDPVIRRAFIDLLHALRPAVIDCLKPFTATGSASESNRRTRP